MRKFGLSDSCGKFWNRGLSAVCVPSVEETWKVSAGDGGRSDREQHLVSDVAHVLVALLADGYPCVPIRLPVVWFDRHEVPKLL